MAAPNLRIEDMHADVQGLSLLYWLANHDGSGSGSGIKVLACEGGYRMDRHRYGKRMSMILGLDCTGLFWIEQHWS